MDESDLRVLVAVGPYPQDTLGILPVAADVARRLGAEVHVVQSIDSIAMQPVAAIPTALAADLVLTTDVPTSSKELRSAALTRLQSDIQGSGHLESLGWTPHVVDGPAVHEILDLAEEIDAYMIIIGAPHHGLVAAWSHLLDGSVARGLGRRSARPILQVPVSD